MRAAALNAGTDRQLPQIRRMRDLLSRGERRRPAADRGAGTLATEIWAALHGVAYIRTHEPGALRGFLSIWRALERDRNTG